MAFDRAGITAALHGVGKSRVWHYKSNDLLATIVASGYFNSMSAEFELGDLILVAGDLDGTPFTTQLTVNSATGAATVTTLDLASATIEFTERVALTVEIAAIGTAKDKYVASPVAGKIVGVSGVSQAAGTGSGGTSTIAVVVPTATTVAELAFLEDVAAGDAVVAGSIAAHSALTAGAVIKVTTDGTGAHTGAAVVTILIDPAQA